MDDLDRVLTEYVAAHTAAGVPPDLSAYLSQLEEPERAILIRRIEDYLMSAPRRAWDKNAFDATLNSPLMREIETAVRGASGLWPALLPRLRNSARLKRREVVKRLAYELGVGGREEKVGRYYHQMEQGLLDEQGVSDTVLEKLGRILGSSREALRDAGQALGPGTLGGVRQPVSVFARTVTPNPAYEPAEPASSSAASHEEPWDEVDELFAGHGR